MPRVDDWFLMSSLWPTVGLCGLYYYIIRVWGPRFMKDREPYNIQTLITAYNLFQTIFSLWIFWKATRFWFTGTIMSVTMNNILHNWVFSVIIKRCTNP